MLSSLLTFVNLSLIDNFILFPIGSLCIFLIFAALGMRNCRVAWFLSLSAPGAIVGPVVIIEMLADQATAGYVIGGLAIFMALYPGFWVFPIVFAVQVWNLFRKKWDVMTRESYIYAAILLGLYFWTGLVLKIVTRHRY